MRTFVAAVVTALVGAIAGAACDQLHVQSGVLAYARPMFLEQAWWVAPMFGAFTPVIVWGATPFAPGAGAAPARDLVTGAFWLVAAYAGSGLVDARAPTLYAVALLATWLVRVALAERRLQVAGFSLLLAAGGAAWEAFLSSTGAFWYTRPVYWVPLWLPGLYLHGAPLALAVARRVKASA